MTQHRPDRNIPSSTSPLADPKALLAEAREHWRAGRIGDAEAIYRRLIAGRPEDPEPRYLLGSLYAQVARPADAVAQLDAAVRLSPASAPLLNHYGRALVEAGRRVEAEAAFQRAIHLRVDFSEAHFNLGTLFRQDGRLAEAVAAYRRAADANPRALHVLINLGITLQEMTAYDEAVKALHQAIAVDGHSFEAYYNLGGVLASQRRLPEAAMAYQAAAGINARVAWVHVNLGFVLQELGQIEAAVAGYRRAIALAPDLAQAHINLGSALHQQHDLQGSLAAVRRSIELEPRNARSQATLAQTLREIGDFAGAEAAYRHVLELEPGQPLAQAHLSILLQQTGRLEAAQELLDYDRLLRRHPLGHVKGWPSVPAFNADLARAIYEHPTLMPDPPGKATMRGSQTLEFLHSDDPALQMLRRLAEAAVSTYIDETVAAAPHLFPPPPDTRRLHGWGVVLRSGGHQSAHFHPAGIVSGVYYVRVPAVVRRGQDGDAGCIRFGEPEPGLASTHKPPGRFVTSVRPEEGLMILFPSYFWHQTIPFESDEDRICIAFDLLKDPARQAD